MQVFVKWSVDTEGGMILDLSILPCIVYALIICTNRGGGAEKWLNHVNQLNLYFNKHWINTDNTLNWMCIAIRK